MSGRKSFWQILNSMLKRNPKAHLPIFDEGLFTRIKKRPYQSLILFLCLINIILGVVNIGLWISAANQRLFTAADFTSFYTGAYLVRTGQGENLFNPDIQSSYQQQFMNGFEFQGGVLLFPNPPHVAIALAPITYLPLEAAFYLWTILQVGVLIWVIFVLNKLFSSWEQYERVVLFITLLAFWPLTYNFLLGQFSLLMLLGMLQFYIAFHEHKQIRAGLWFAFMFIKPQALLIPGMLALHKRYLKVALTITASGLFLFLLSYFFLGRQTWFGYLQTVRMIGSYFEKFGVHPNTEYTIRGILSNFMGADRGWLVNTISIGLLFIGMAIIFVLWNRHPQEKSPRFQLVFAFTIALSIFLSLHLNPHDSLLMIAPAAIFYEYLRERGFSRRAYAVLLLISPPIFMLTTFTGFGLFGKIRLPVVFIFVLLVWMVKYLSVEYKGQVTRSPVESAVKPD